jgi:hypothetical protein
MFAGRRQLGAALGFWVFSAAFLPISGWAKDEPSIGGDKKASPAKVTIAVVGDSLADGIWGGIYRKLYRDKRFSVYRGAKNSIGFGGGDLLDTLDRAFEAGPVDAVVMMIGANDRRGIYTTDGKLEAAYKSPQWPAAYRARVDKFMDTATGHLVPLVWVLLPVMREDGADTDSKQINDIVCSAADSHALVATVPTRPLTLDPEGKYAAYLKDAKGHQRLVRDSDGIHFTDYGYDMIANQVLAKLNDVSSKIGSATSAAK